MASREQKTARLDWKLRVYFLLVLIIIALIFILNAYDSVADPKSSEFFVFWMIPAAMLLPWSLLYIPFYFILIFIYSLSLPEAPATSAAEISFFSFMNFALQPAAYFVLCVIYYYFFKRRPTKKITLEANGKIKELS